MKENVLMLNLNIAEEKRQYVMQSVPQAEHLFE